jgi:hypothetical protein
MSTTPPPPTYPDGACVECLRDYASCTYHRSEDRHREKARSENLRAVLAGFRHRELSAICLRFELESDEGGAAMEKAARIYDRQPAF